MIYIILKTKEKNIANNILAQKASSITLNPQFHNMKEKMRNLYQELWV